ncbi:MAG TPA: methyltransferase domain-containing protein [Planctomycetes bacterium]|nr:methyltransferase domain-containing protein [Planctomycetota bacterium]
MRVIDGLEWCYYRLFRKHDARGPLSRLLASLPTDAAILDFGGGDGRITTLRGDVFWIVADVDEEALRKVRRGRHIAAVRVARRPPYPFQDDRFSAVLLVDVLHHLDSAVDTLAALGRAMTPDARLILVEYDGRRWITRLFQMLVRLDGRRCTPRTPTMVRGVIEAAGFHVEEKPIDRLRRLYIARSSSALSEETPKDP